MAFFARPNLDNTQFKQLKGGEPLTLSGQTQIATTTGLTLIGDAGTGSQGGGMYIPIIATGASNNFVLTYDSSQKAIVLKQSTASGGTTVYPYSGLTTCTVGGLSASTCIFNCEVVDIIQCMVSPTVYPTLTNPSISSFTLSPSTTLYEVGCNVDVCGVTNFNPGVIDPVYPPTACSCRSDGTRCYSYNVFGVPDVCCITNAPSNTYPFTTYTIQSGSNSVSSAVYYCSGTQPYDSSGAAYCSPLSEGATSLCTRTITGIYPYYWGTLTCAAAAGVGRPTACCIKDGITGGTLTNGTCNKVVSTSTGTINVTFGSTSSDYLWFATPVASTTKTCWYETALNNGTIGGSVTPGGNLFPDPDTVTGVDSFEACWSGQSYKIYISNYQSASSTNMELRNS